MGTLTVSFEGVCTHVDLATIEQAVGNVNHRVVLVNAEDGADLYDEPIPPHRAFLMIDSPASSLFAAALDELPPAAFAIQENASSWKMRGIRLRVANVEGSTVAVAPSPFTIPSLITQAHGQPFPLSHDVVFGSAAACHFDVTAGTFTAHQASGGARFTTLDVTTTDDGFVLLLIETLDGLASGEIMLVTGSTIVVTNTGVDLQDKPFDFYLHYLIADPRPTEAPILPVSQNMLAIVRPSGFYTEALGPGCSNSNFP